VDHAGAEARRIDAARRIVVSVIGALPKVWKVLASFEMRVAMA